MKLVRPGRRTRARHGEGGYMLLFLMLAVAVLTISMLEVAYNYRRMIRRDQEVEMIHRGEQYARAVRRFYKKNGRYPASIEQLEKLNNIRFLRKRYKDPMSEDGEWKVVHPGDVKIVGVAGGLLGASSAVNNPLGVNSGGSNSTSNQASGSSQQDSDAGTGSTGSANGSSAPSTFGSSNVSASSFSGTGNAANGQILGGGGMLGVVSKSKRTGIHSFGGKGKYSEWFFIYAPTQDRGQLIVGPYNPNMFFGNFGSNNLNNPTNTQGGTGSQNNTLGSAPGVVNPSGSTGTTTTTTTPNQ